MRDALIEAPARLGVFGRKLASDADSEPHAAVKAVLAARGEVSSLVYAGALLDQIEMMDDSSLEELARHISSTYDIDPGELARAAGQYRNKTDGDGLADIARLAEPQWLDLFRRLNATGGGTARLVRLRSRLLGMRRSSQAAANLESGLTSLLRMWFNPGFLMLEPVDWSTPANVLEKIIEYQSVHAINSWDELRARLAPEDRRCFAFFHPLMPGEPLIFVEVALTAGMPARIDEVIGTDGPPLRAEDATTAVFYSISNCQRGLDGISFGNFLIKKVAQELRHELEDIKDFVTLSPVPDLMGWLRVNNAELAKQFEKADDAFWKAEADELRDEFLAAALDYFTRSERKDGLPNDRVARFHIGNGAVLERLNFAADRSGHAVKKSGGLMVNYLYDLKKVEANHEKFHETKTMPMSPELKAKAKSARK